MMNNEQHTPAAGPDVTLDKQAAANGKPQPIIGRLMDQISALPVLWGLNEPGALLRNSDVWRVLVAAGREQAALAAPVQTQVAADDRELPPLPPAAFKAGRSYGVMKVDAWDREMVMAYGARRAEHAFSVAAEMIPTQPTLAAPAAAPQVVADERAYVQNLELVINRLETISQNNTDIPRTLADEALICARAAIADAPAQADATITDTSLVDLCALMNAASVSNSPILLSAQSAGALVEAMTTSAPAQEQDPIGTLARNRNGDDESLIFTPLCDIHVIDGMPIYAAAPVQSQEPVAEVSAMPGTSGFTMAVFKADDMPIGSKVYRAPVQPVAVPDGWKLVPIDPTIEMIAALGWGGDEVLAVGHGLISVGIAKDYAAMLAAAPAAPAAQGNALNARRYEYLRSDDEGIEFRDYGSFPHPWRSDCPSGKELDKIIDAAIAAKAAS